MADLTAIRGTLGKEQEMSDLRITLKAARVNAGLGQKDVAKALKITPQTIVNWERGTVRPSEATVIALAQMYGIDVDNIFLPEVLGLT